MIADQFARARAERLVADTEAATQYAEAAFWGEANRGRNLMMMAGLDRTAADEAQRCARRLRVAWLDREAGVEQTATGGEP